MSYLELQANVLKWIGIFPPVDSSSSPTLFRAYTVYRVLFISVVSVVAFATTLQLLVAPDLTMIARTIDLWTMFVSGIFKWYCMARSSDDFMEFNTNLMAIQNQGLILYGRRAQRFTADYMGPVRQTTVIYLLCGLCAVLLYTINPLLNYPQNGRSDLVYFNDPNSYPLCAWMPFTVKERWVFNGIFFLHVFTMAGITNVYLGIDSFMFGAMYAVGGQIELLNASLDNIEKTLVSDGDDQNSTMKFEKDQQNQFHSMIVQSIKHHILILKYIRKLRVMFSLLILVDYLHGLISLTFAMFQTTISVDVSEKIAVIFFIALSLGHQFLNNFFGEYIIQKQMSVRTSLYNVPWWRADKQVRGCLTLMITRSNEQTIIDGFYMYKLCFKSFIAFVKALYTYYMVLRQLQ
ncbi:odorant receptor Or1 [Adelges cooleyi]|uniref:odorant receptor Or1 n=1 Tax=Adelges cooleyi TaxID=133065 RepID=UPI00217F4B6E|nr:odorant receptor Or1 [Adelges cooleyi]